MGWALSFHCIALSTLSLIFCNVLQLYTAVQLKGSKYPEQSGDVLNFSVVDKTMSDTYKNDSRKAVRAHRGSNILWWAFWTLNQSMAKLMCVSHSEVTLRTIYINWATCVSATAPEPIEKVSLGSGFSWCHSDLCGSHWQVMVQHRQDLLPFNDHLDVLETFLLVAV